MATANSFCTPQGKTPHLLWTSITLEPNFSQMQPATLSRYVSANRSRNDSAPFRRRGTRASAVGCHAARFWSFPISGFVLSASYPSTWGRKRRIQEPQGSSGHGSWRVLAASLHGTREFCENAKKSTELTTLDSATSVVRKKGIHIIADAVTDLVTNLSDSI